MCLCVGQCVNTLTAEPIDLPSQNLVQGLTLMKSRPSLLVKVVGERSSHQVEKCNFGVLAWVLCPVIDISACKGFMCVHAQNFTHAGGAATLKCFFSSM